MKLSQIVFSLLLVLGLGFSTFFMEDHLYQGENVGMVSYEPFSFSGIQYKLVKINQNLSFILNPDGFPIEDKAKISDIVSSYYKLKYAPSDQDLSDVRTLLIQYNSSRNDGNQSATGVKIPGKEEQECKNVLLLSDKILYFGKPLTCVDDASCNLTTKVIYYSEYAPGDPIRKTMTFASAFKVVKSFGFASHTLDTTIEDSIKKIDSATEDTLKDSLLSIKSNIPLLQSAEKDIEGSILRFPKDKEDLNKCKQEQCLTLCPPLSLYDKSLTDLNSKIDFILSNSAQYFGSKSVAASLYQTTQDRLFFKDANDKSIYYKSVLKPIAPNISIVISKAEEVSSYINNQSFKLKLDSLKDARDRINLSFVKRDFSNIDEDIVQYKYLAEEVKNLTGPVFENYKDSFDAKQKTTALIFSLESKDLNSESATRLSELQSAVITLDSQFAKGLSPDQYLYLQQSYSDVSTQANSLMTSNSDFVLFSKFRSLARKLNVGIASFSESSSVIPESQFSQLAKKIPLSFSIIFFISLTSVVVLIGISSVKVAKSKGSLILFGVIIITLLGVVLVSSLGFYYYLDKTSNSADSQEFVVSIMGEKNVAIVMQLDNAPDNAISNMKYCAKALNNSLNDAEANRSVILYEVKGSECKITGSITNLTNTSSCTPKTVEPKFYFKYSQDSLKPSFSAVFDKSAHISGNAEYYQQCSISAIFG